MADFNKSGTLPINVVFTASDTTLTNHVWKVDGVVEPGATGPTFTKSFNAYKDAYVVEHTGTNSCGSSCTPVTRTVSITALPQQTVGFGATELVYGVVGLALLGTIWYSMQQKKK